MNVNVRDYNAHIYSRMRQWWTLAGSGLNKSDRTKARKNFRALVRKHPELAKEYGFDSKSVQA